jgi:hypothetical protein
LTVSNNRPPNNQLTSTASPPSSPTTPVCARNSRCAATLPELKTQRLFLPAPPHDSSAGRTSANSGARSAPDSKPARQRWPCSALSAGSLASAAVSAATRARSAGAEAAASAGKRARWGARLAGGKAAAAAAEPSVRCGLEELVGRKGESSARSAARAKGYCPGPMR